MKKTRYIKLDRKIIYHLRSLEAAALVAYLRIEEPPPHGRGRWFVAKIPEMVDALGIGFKRVRRHLRNLHDLRVIDTRFSKTWPAMLEYRLDSERMKELFG